MRTIGRRSVLRGLGHTATFGSLAAALPSLARAAQPAAAAAAPQKICLAMLYPSGEGLSFDADGFRDRHLALLKKSYGTAIERVELRVSPPPPTPPPVAEGETAPPMPAPQPVLAAVSLWIGNVGEFIQRSQASAKTVAADMANITKSAPMVQFDVLEGQGGVAAGSVLGGTTVVSSYFFAKEGGTIDAAVFGKTYLPKVVAAYGPEALQRAEVWRGELAQGGGKPLIASALHLYVKDSTAFDTASNSEAVKALGTEAATISTLAPVNLVMSVHATG
ncbi:MAG: hypothetical protein M3Y79_10845 [Pseudomonadota bacterium]|nr:hypothetical protein [Pseudomonadota bacterium]